MGEPQKDLAHADPISARSLATFICAQAGGAAAGEAQQRARHVELNLEQLDAVLRQLSHWPCSYTHPRSVLGEGICVTKYIDVPICSPSPLHAGPYPRPSSALFFAPVRCLMPAMLCALCHRRRRPDLSLGIGATLRDEPQREMITSSGCAQSHCRRTCDF